jgi:hypothetical protein
MNEAAAAIARAHDVPGSLAHALINLGTVLMGRDLPAAMDALREARDVALRSGIVGFMEYASGNYASTLWTAGRLEESRAVIAEVAQAATHPTIQVGARCLEAFIADAKGELILGFDDAGSLGSAYELAAAGVLELMQLTAAGELGAAAALAEPTLAHLVTAGGLDDDFMHFWPPLVRAALAAGDMPMAQRLLHPVSTAAAGIVSAAVAAHLLNLRGLVGAARGDQAAGVEADLRAGVAALAAFGAVGWSARAEEDLARWLLGHGRSADAQPHVDHVRAAYAAIGATGWLSRLESLIPTSPVS